MNLWCDEQLVVTIAGPEGDREVVVAQPYARVGAQEGCEVALPGAGVPGRAWYFHATEDGVFGFLLDAEDPAGADRGRWFGASDRVVVGPYLIGVRRLDDAADRAAPPLPPLSDWGSAAPPLPVVNIFFGQALKNKRRFRARLNLLGRRPECALQLRGTQVSSFHCALFWHEQRLWCVDLLSSNGTFLHNGLVRCAELHFDDRLQLGEFGIVYFRWSPRTSMYGLERTDLDGGEGASDSHVLSAEPEPSLIDADAAGKAPAGSELSSGPPTAPIVSPTVSPDALSAAAFAAQWESERQELRAQMAAELARLGQEREQLRAQWDAAAHDLAERTSQLHVEAARIAEERTALEATRHAWQEEQLAWSEQLAERSQKLARLEEEIASATHLLAHRLATLEAAPLTTSTDTAAAPRAESPPAAAPALPPDPAPPVAPATTAESIIIAPPAAPIDLTTPKPSAADHPVEELAAMPLAASAESLAEAPPVPRHEIAPLAEVIRHGWRIPAGELDHEERLPGLPASANLVPAEAPLAIKALAPVMHDVPAGRRSRLVRSENAASVSDRLADLSYAKRQRTIMVWTTIAVTAATLGAVALGVWNWLQR